ncbi:MAG: hypothetical protein DMD99_19090 [Candidatus Rokuibacteriota bacterium]|nr:MAG: hypothetical protein DMD99_19090 [Candidatus Rokubacteria bacterium]
MSRSSTRPDGRLPVRIALFTNNYLPFCGGVTISVETLRLGLEAAGHEAWVFGPRLAGAQDVSGRIVRYPSIPATTYPEFALAVPYSRRIGRLVAELDFDVVHAHHPFLLGPAARRLARRARRPLVFTYHTRYEKYAHYVPLPLGLVESAALRLSAGFAARADAVLAPSTVIRDELHARGVRTPIAVVPTGVYVGRLDREKSVDRVLVAFDRIASTVAAARLALVGHGTEAERLRRQARALPVARRIRFLGVRPHHELVECYRAADVFLFASETETQGLVLAEAAACGLPAVAVDAPGCDEVVRDGETGVLTKSDPAALAEAAIGLLLDLERRRGMARRAREVAEREFDVRLQIDRTMAVYLDAIARVR